MTSNDWPKATDAELKRELLQYLEALRGRQECYSVRFVTGRLKAAHFPTAAGWAPLLEKYKAAAFSRDRMLECLTTIEEIYADALTFADRAVFVYPLGKGEVKRAVAAIDGLVDRNSEFAQRFPFPMTEARLRRGPFNGVFCRKVEHDDGSVRLFACCKRAYRTRETIDTTALDEDVRMVLESYDEVFGIKSGFVQGFDSIVFRPKNDTVEIQIDIACRLTKEDFFAARDFYANRINSFLEPTLAIDQWLLTSRNFFPLISKLYSELDGIVNHLGHSTTTNSVKEERMRGRQRDLRTEDFHEKGMEAIHGLTDEYSIRKSWFSKDGSRYPTVIIPGSYKLAGSADARIGYAIIEGCSNGDDFAMVLSKLA
jgi:hypothetical protein